MNEQLKKITEEALSRIASCEDQAGLNEVRVAYLGKKGEITQLMKSMKDIPAEERPAFGQLVNDARSKVEEAIEEAALAIKRRDREKKFREEEIDVTLPAKKLRIGHGHPCQRALDELERIFTGMGYEVVEGPEIEYQEYNFTKLNIPEGHPARDEQDTFYITDQILLRSQTSPVQARTMEKGKLPIRMISPGRVFRSDSIDATHSPSFHQVEGLAVDKHITMTDLKGTLTEFAKELFGPDTKTRFRPHHFNFTEPSAEMDVSCFKCHGKGCRFCKGEGWIEILGCGMVHPNVLDMCGIDDMRLLYENDQRFLDQF